SDTLPPSCRSLESPGPCTSAGQPEIKFEERGFCGDPRTLPFRVTEALLGWEFTVTGDPDGTPFEIATFRGKGLTLDPSVAIKLPASHDLVADVTNQPDRDLTIQVEVQPPPYVDPPTDFRYTVHIDKTAPTGDVFRPVDGESLCVDPRRGVPTIRATVRTR